MDQPTESPSTIKVPENYCCSIVHQAMVDPVNASDGHTYEREAIERWLSKNSVSPMTRELMEATGLSPNLFAKQEISQFIKANKAKLSAEDVYLPRAWQQAVMDAIFADDVAAFKRALDKDPMGRLQTCMLHQVDSNPEDLPTEFKYTALHLACKVGSVEMIKTVVAMLGDKLNSALAQPRPKDFKPVGTQALLLSAAKIGDIDGVQLALRLWADIHSVDADGMTALHHACQLGNKALVKNILCVSDLSINGMDAKGHTPLYYAVVGAHLAVVHELLSFSQLTTIASYDESAASILHVCFGVDDEYRLQMLQGLLSHSPQLVERINAQGETVLHLAADAGSITFVKLFLRLKADPNVKSARGWNALHYAIAGGYEPIVSYLIEQVKVDERTKTETGRLPFELAMAHGHAEIVEYLSSRLNPWEGEMLDLRSEVRNLQQKLEEVDEEQQITNKALEKVSGNFLIAQKSIGLYQQAIEEQKEMFVILRKENALLEARLSQVQLQESAQLKKQLQAQNRDTAILRSDFFKSKLAKWKTKHHKELLDNQDALVNACMVGNLAEVKRLLAVGARATIPNSAGVQPLVAAARRLRIKIVYYLEKHISAKGDEMQLPAGLFTTCYNAVSEAVVCPFTFKEGMRLSQFCQWVHENRQTFMLYVKGTEPELYNSLAVRTWKRFCAGNTGITIIVNDRRQMLFMVRTLGINLNSKSDALYGNWYGEGCWAQICEVTSRGDVEIVCKKSYGGDYTLAAWYARQIPDSGFDTPRRVDDTRSVYDTKSVYNKSVREIIRKSNAVGTSAAKERLLAYFINYAPEEVKSGMGM